MKSSVENLFITLFRFFFRESWAIRYIRGTTKFDHTSLELLKPPQCSSLFRNSLTYFYNIIGELLASHIIHVGQKISRTLAYCCCFFL